MANNSHDNPHCSAGAQSQKLRPFEPHMCIIQDPGQWAQEHNRLEMQGLVIKKNGAACTHLQHHLEGREERLLELHYHCGLALAATANERCHRFKQEVVEAWLRWVLANL
jgi:hypothetical protein